MSDNKREIQKKIIELSRMDEPHWESVCKCCGLCCLLKHTRRTQGTFYTSVACDELNLSTHKCNVYNHRLQRINCAKVDMRVVLRDGVLPNTCGYMEYIFGPAQTPIQVDFGTVKHEHELEPSDLDYAQAPFTADIYRRWPGPWDYLIPDSLQWRTRAIELRDKYQDFGCMVLRHMERQKQK